MTDKPVSIETYRAVGAQPAEAELTPESVRKYDLFTEAEIARMLPWEMTLINETPYEQVKAIVDHLRAVQKDD